jgi:hypothetical protein
LACGFRRFRDDDLKDAVRQISLDGIRVEVTRKRELALEVADLVFAMDRAEALRSSMTDAAIDGQDSLFQGDVQSIRTNAREVGGQNQPLLRLVDVHKGPEHRAVMGPLACLLVRSDLLG